MADLDLLKRICPEKFKRNDIETSELFCELYCLRARYVPERKSYYFYDGHVWKKDVEELNVHRLAKEFVHLVLEYFTKIYESEDAVKYYRKYQNYNNRKKLIQDVKSVLPLSYSSFDKAPHMLNCRNGTINLVTGDFTPHNPLDYFTKMANVNYAMDARSELWERFISSVMEGDKTKIDFLQRCLGYSITGTTFFEKFFILYGKSSRNGKGTLNTVIQSMLGDYAMTASAETFESRYYQKGNGGPCEDIARLAGSRFVSVSEPDEGMVLNSALVKILSGNDKITARYMYENSFEFTASFKIWFNTNHLPQITDDTVFKSDRVVIIPFNHHFAEEERDYNMKSKLTKQEVLSAVLNWCIDGFQKVIKEGTLTVPDTIKTAITEYRTENDRIGEFMNDCYVQDMDKKKRERISDVFRIYMKWCSANNYRALNKRKFREKLSERGTVITYNNQYYLEGWYRSEDIPDDFKE